MTQFATYAFYDKKGRRLSVFCRFLNALEAEIVTITCSKSDQFSKKISRAMYAEYISGEPFTFKPTTKIVAIKLEEGEQTTLINYCQANYYTFVQVEMPVTVLFKYTDYKEILV